MEGGGGGVGMGRGMAFSGDVSGASIADISDILDVLRFVNGNNKEVAFWGILKSFKPVPPVRVESFKLLILTWW